MMHSNFYYGWTNPYEPRKRMNNPPPGYRWTQVWVLEKIEEPSVDHYATNCGCTSCKCIREPKENDV